METLKQRFADFAVFVAHMDSKGMETSKAISTGLGLSWIVDKDFSNPASFTDEEVKQILEALDNQE